MRTGVARKSQLALLEILSVQMTTPDSIAGAKVVTNKQVSGRGREMETCLNCVSLCASAARTLRRDGSGELSCSPGDQDLSELPLLSHFTPPHRMRGSPACPIY